MSAAMTIIITAATLIPFIPLLCLHRNRSLWFYCLSLCDLSSESSHLTPLLFLSFLRCPRISSRLLSVFLLFYFHDQVSPYLLCPRCRITLPVCSSCETYRDPALMWLQFPGPALSPYRLRGDNGWGGEAEFSLCDWRLCMQTHMGAHTSKSSEPDRRRNTDHQTPDGGKSFLVLTCCSGGG